MNSISSNSPDQINKYLQNLESRISKIEERLQIIHEKENDGDAFTSEIASDKADRTEKLEFQIGALPMAMYTLNKKDTISPQSVSSPT